MLNYIWIALILIGVFVAVGTDIANEFRNPYQNGAELTLPMDILRSPGPLRSTWEGDLVVTPRVLNAFYGREVLAAEARQRVTVAIGEEAGASIVIPIGEGTPPVWSEMARFATSPDRLTGTVHAFEVAADKQTATVRFTLEPIRFTRMKSISQAAFDYAATAVTIALGLIGIMALWLGVMKVAEEAGVLKILTRILAPITRRIFPDVPPDHPAVGAMIMNIAANMLGLSNAATPMGLKAMEELNKLNPKVGTATNAMVTFLAINTGGLILIPATAMAVRAAAGSANPGIIIGTSIVGASCATVAGVLASKLLQRLRPYKKALEV